MPLDSSYVGTGLVFPLHVQTARGRGYRKSDGTVLEPNIRVLAEKLYTDVPANVTNGISASHAGASSAGTTSMTLGGSLTSGGVATLTPARNVVITVTHASSVVAMSGTITGTRLGRAVTEAWSVTATGTTKTFTGAVAFDTVTSITEVVAANASANTIIAGTGKVLGLDVKARSIKVVAEEEDGAAPTAGVIVKASTSANADARGTYTPNSSPDGSKDFSVWYVGNFESIY